MGIWITSILQNTNPRRWISNAEGRPYGLRLLVISIQCYLPLALGDPTTRQAVTDIVFVTNSKSTVIIPASSAVRKISSLPPLPLWYSLRQGISIIICNTGSSRQNLSTDSLSHAHSRAFNTPPKTYPSEPEARLLFPLGRVNALVWCHEQNQLENVIR